MATKRHNVSLRIGDQIIDRWQSYSITNDMMTPADGFELSLSPGVKAAYDLVPPDSLVEVRIDDNPVLTGYIDDRDLQIDRSGSMLAVAGRDKSGRMVDESALPLTFGALDLKTLAEQLAEGDFEVLLDNKLNRDLIRGRRSNRAPASSEPLFAKRSAAPKKVELGEMRWAVLEHFLKPARLLAWTSADGKNLIVGKPNYAQLPQFRFFLPKEGSKRLTEGNIKSLKFGDSVANRYSRITVFGQGKGNGSSYGSQIKLSSTVTQGDDIEGTGDAFQFRKRLFLVDPDSVNAADNEERAQREMDFREGEALVVEITVEGHSQARFPGDQPTLYGFDLMCELEIEEIEFSGQFLITSVIFGVDRDGGEVTQIKMIPKDTELVT